MVEVAGATVLGEVADQAIGPAGTKPTATRGALLSAPSARPLARCTEHAGRERVPWGARALTDKLINMKDTHGKEPKHRRETPPRNGKEEKGRGKKGAAPQKEGTNGRASCAGHALGGRQLT